MTEREKILGRIREALVISAPLPGTHDHGNGHAHASPAASTPKQLRQWLPLVGDSFEDRATAFAATSVELKTEFHLLNSADEAAAQLATISTAEGWKRIAQHRGQLTDPICAGLKLPSLRTDEPYQATDLEKCDVGITECDALIAQTGSVMLTARSGGGRALSVLPPHHVVLARREQLVSDLPAGFALLKEKYSTNYPSFMTVITGPSRTGDIERILVLGAHGPKKLTVICF